MKSVLSQHWGLCQTHVQRTYELMLSAVADADGATEDPVPEERRQASSSHLDCQLNRHRWRKISAEWRSCIVGYALALTELQRAERLLIKELRNPGHANWDPLEDPESLLLEVESGLLIRDVQEDIALQMREVAENATMQLNMGEAKSLVVVPRVAAALADGTQVVRVITAKPQARQMFQMLISKLGGLLDRRIYHMPFSRCLKLDEADAAMIDNMCRECMSTGGVLLIQQEHRLSFKLMGLECLISGKHALGRSFLRTQEFFNTSSRDIVDESDKNFNVRFELIYTMGMQRPIELSPRRWVCIQTVLDLVKKFAREMARESPSSLKVYERSDGIFPVTRILDNNGQRLLVTGVAKFISDVGLHGFPFPDNQRLSEPPYSAISLSPRSPPTKLPESKAKARPDSGRRRRVPRSFFYVDFWRAGCCRSRSGRNAGACMPYQAKDSPTLRSDFSRPDIVIVFTCLSHYYGGMDDDDLFLAFDHLLKSDQAEVEYQQWTKDAPDLAPAFRQSPGINLKDPPTVHAAGLSSTPLREECH
ncbi:hypothetical protein LTR41_010938 [Exophiala xenobiotica]|nr:hypothetical protein LTR41_010938 [Exophiala xenobiotica]KAK5551106.1 hypothetical protein LTR46_010859 [Exophiala xenobiotica]